MTPGTLNLEIATRICRRVARGISISLACEAERIDQGVFRRTVMEAREGEFRGLYARERVEFEESLIERILSGEHKGGPEQFILERKCGWAKSADNQPHGEPEKATDPDRPRGIHIPPDELAELQRLGEERFAREGRYGHE